MEAVFKGRTYLDTKGMQAGFARLRFAVKQFNRDVTAPFMDAASAMAQFTKRAALAGTALSTLGVSRVFKFEGMEQQFATLMGDSEKARKTIRNLLDEAAKTPFSADNYAAAYKTLLTTANGELATGDNMRRIGDAAAVSGKQIDEVAGQVSYLYAMLKAGKGGGAAARQLLKDSIITLDTYKLIDKEGKNAANLGAVWSRVVADLNNFSGGMERVSRTGSGSLKVLRNLADTALQEIFAELADSIKDVVFNLAEMLRAARASGQLAEVGKKLGAIFRKVLDGIYRAIQAYRQLDEQSRASVNNILAGMAAVAVAWRAGVLVPMIKASVGLVTFIVPLFSKMTAAIVSNFGLIAVGLTKALAVIGVALAGFNLGNALYQSFGDTAKKIVETIATALETIVQMLGGVVVMVGKSLGKALWEGITNPDFAFDTLKNTFYEEGAKLSKTADRLVGQFEAIWTQESTPPKSFGEAWQELPKKVGGEITGKLTGFALGDLLKMPGMEGLDKWFAKMKELGNIKMPEMPKPPDLTGERQNAEAIANANRKANAYTIRGYYFRKLDMNAIMAAAKNNGKLAEHNRKREQDAQKKAQSKQTLKPIETEFQRSNRLLEEIKRNTGKTSGAVYA